MLHVLRCTIVRANFGITKYVFCPVTASHSVSLSHHTFYGRVSNNRERASEKLTGPPDPGSRDPTLIFCLGAPEFLVTPLVMQWNFSKLSSLIGPTATAAKPFNFTTLSLAASSRCCSLCLAFSSCNSAACFSWWWLGKCHLRLDVFSVSRLISFLQSL